MYHVENAFWKNTKNSRKYSFSCHFFLLLLFGFFVVFSEHIKKMVNNVRGKDFHSHSLRLSSNVPVHFDIKRKNEEGTESDTSADSEDYCGTLT